MNAKLWSRWVARLWERRTRREIARARRLMLEPLEERVTPATITWIGAGTNSNWSNPANWDLGRAPLPGDDLVFSILAPPTNRTPIYDLSGTPLFNSLTISASGYSLGGTVASPTLALSGPINVGTNLGTLSITLNLRLTPPTSTLQQTITVNSGSELIISGQLSSGYSNPTLAAQQTLTKAGAGTLVLGGDNSPYTGAFALANNGGVLAITHHNALGLGNTVSGVPTAGETTVNTGAQLQLRSLSQPVTARLRLNGSGLDGSGVLYNASGNNTWAGPITLDSNSTIGGAAGTSLTITGLISDTGAARNLTKEGPGRVILARSGGNTYRGQTIINDGILTIRDPLSLGAGATFGTPQHNTPQAGVIVTNNPVTGKAGTLQLEFTSLTPGDPNGVLQNRDLPYDPVSNPYVGFQVFNQLLTLNGPGFNNMGALHNLAGNNIWSGDITLGSPAPASGSINIGAAANTNLTLSGVLANPNRSAPLVKVGSGRLILNNANTYTSGTTVIQGALNIRDSKALGIGGVSVADGAALELEVDRGIDGTPLRNNNRNLGFDSVLGTSVPGIGQGQEIAVFGNSGTFTLTFKGETTAHLPYNATASDIQNALNALSTITAGGGSVTVTQVGSIFRVMFNGPLGANPQPLMTGSGSGGASVVISPIYGLRVTNGLLISGNGLNNTGALRSISGINTWAGNISTVGGSIGVEPDNRPGHPTAGPDYFTFDHSLTVSGVISGSSLRKLRDGHLILTGNNTYSGDTYIDAGWVTIGDNTALGTRGGVPITQRQNVFIANGGALHIRPDPVGSSFTVSQNFVVSGFGINHPYDKLNQNGAILNLEGVNTLSGIIRLDGNAGIGVEQLPPPANQQSQLRLTGYLWDNGNTVGSLTKLGSQRLVIQAYGNYTGDVTVANGVLLVQNDTALGAPGGGTVTVQNGAALELANSLTDQNGGVLSGLGIWGKNLVLHGPGNSTFNRGTVAVLSGRDEPAAPLGAVPVGAADHMWRGPVTLASDDVVFEVQDDSRLTITGDIGEVPGTAAGLTLRGGGALSLFGNGSYGGTTHITAGVLTIGSGDALGTPGHSELQTITLLNDFPLITAFTFKGYTTGPIIFANDGPTDAAAIANALNALPSIGGIGGMVSVQPLDPGVYRVSFEGSLSGFDQPLMTATVFGPGSINIVENRKGAGGTIIEEGACLQLAGSFTVAGEPLLINGSGSGALPNIPLQWHQIGPAPVTNGPNPGNQSVMGRVTATVVDPRDSNIIYMATAGGGAWKTIDGGRTWRQIFDAIPEIQTVTVGGSSSGTFTLTFGGSTTGSLSHNSTAAEVQAALNALPSLADQDASVTVTKTTQGGNVVFRITFGGTLAGYDVPQLTAAASGGATVTVTTVQEGRDPRFAMFIGYITLDPRNPDVVYIGTGEANNSPDSFYGTGIYRSTDGGVTWEVYAGTDTLFYGKGITKMIIDHRQESVDDPLMYVAVADGGSGADELQQIRPSLSNGTSFTLSFTGPDSNGNIVTLTTNSIIYDNRNIVDPSDPFGRTYRQITAAKIAEELNALDNIGGVGGYVVVTPPSGSGINNRYNILFQGTLSQRNVEQLTTNWPTSGPDPFISVNTIRQGGPPGVVNGTEGNAGVWRLMNGTWFNLTGVVSNWRATKETNQSVPPTDGAYFTAGKTGSEKIPNTPGPDDDYRMFFPQTNTVWSDIALVYADRLNGGGSFGPILYAALGKPQGDVNNAVFWTQTPMSNNPVWYVGDPGGSPFNDYNTSSSPPQPSGPTDPDQRPDTGFERGNFRRQSGSSVVGGNPVNGTIKIAAAVDSNLNSISGSGRFNQITLYAAVATPTGALKAIYRTTNGGRNWTNVTSNLPNYLFTLGAFSNAILVVDPNTVYIGGQGVDAQGNQTLWRTTDGGSTWQNISVLNGVGPHPGTHHITRDPAGRIIVSTDAGVWRLEGNNWVNINGNIAGAQVLGVASHPTNPNRAYAGALSNGVLRFNDQIQWPRVAGRSAGRVALDPTNPNNVYAVLKGVAGTPDEVVRSTDGGVNWTTILSSTGSITTPLVLDAVSPNRLLVGGSSLQVSLNYGQSWTTLRGGRVVAIGIAQTQGVYQLDPDFVHVADKGSNSYDPDTIYVSTGDDIYLTKDGGLTWVNRTGDVAGGGIVDIAVDPTNRDTIYAVRNYFGSSQVWYSTNAGQDWEEIGTAKGLPDVPVWKVVVDPRNGNVYVGTDSGVFVLKGGPNSGNFWQRFGVGMPNVQVRDLELNLTTNTLLAGTYGRSVYQLFLDTAMTANTPLAAAVVGLSGQSVWAGPVILNGDSANKVTIGAYGIPNLPNPRTNASVTFNGVISDLTPGGNPLVRKIGFGDIVFAGANIYGGETRVLQGALVVDNAQALGQTANGTVVENGAALHFRSNLGPEPITIYGKGQFFDDHYTGALRNIAGDNTYSGPLTLATDATIGVNSGSSLTISGTVTTGGNSYELNKELLGTLALTGNNSLGGLVNVYQGALRIGSSGALSASNTVTVLNGTQIQLADDTGSPINVAANLRVSGTGIFGTGTIRNLSGDNTWSGNITFEPLPGFAPPAAPPGVVSIAVDRPQDTLTISGNISELTSPDVRIGLEKIGPGRLTLSGTNTYSGATEIYNGTVRITNSAALGSRTTLNTVQQLMAVSDSRVGEIVLSFNGQQETVFWNPQSAPSATAIQTAINGLITLSGLSGSVSVTRREIDTYTANGPRGLQSGDAGYAYVYTITFSGDVAQTNLPLTAFGRNGVTALATFVARGGVNVRVWDGAALELDGSGGDFTVTGKHLTLQGSGISNQGALRNVAGSNTWSGPLFLPVNASVDVSPSTTLTLAGGVQAGSAELHKSGDGTLIFPSGTPANNQSRTVVHKGTLEVNGTVGPVQLDGGTLQGTGTVGTLTLTSAGGVVRPGNTTAGGTIGTLNAAATTFNSATTLYVNLDSTSSHDRLSLSDNIDLGDAILDGTAATTISVGDQFTIIQTSGVRSGRFAGPTTSSTLTGADSTATIVYIGGVKFVANYFNNRVILTRELANVTLSLSTTVSSPVYGQPFQVVATLTPEPLAPTPSGNVVFTYTDPNNNTHTQSVAIDSDGKATFDPTQWGPLVPGTHTFQASYDGYVGSTQVFNPASTTLNCTVGTAPTITTLTGPTTPPAYTEPFTLTATVSSAVDPRISNTSHPPEGTVSFYQGSTLLATVPLVNGVATLNTGTLSTPPLAGNQTFTAVYNGDDNPDYYNSSTSDPFNLNITKANSSITITSSANPSVYGQPVTFTATVTGISGGAVPTGSVLFRRGSLVLGTGTLNHSGIATYTTTLGQLPVSSGLTITAEYLGDTNYNGSTDTLTQRVDRAQTSVTLTSSSNPSVYGEAVTFTATVAATTPGGGTPTGTVTFRLGSTVLGPVTLVGGVATYTTTLGQLPVGSWTITAEYSGSGQYDASSNTLTQVVNKADTTTTVTTSASPSVYGQAVTFTATVAATAPGGGTPTGTVEFYLGSTLLGSGTLNTSGVASYTTTVGQLPAGNGLTITANYLGSDNYNPSSDTVSQDVNKANTNATVVASFNPSGIDQDVTFTATITPLSPGAGNPTGTVDFFYNGNPIGSATITIVSGVSQASFTAPANTLPFGSGTVSVTYGGDANFNNTSGSASHTVTSGTTTSVSGSPNPSVFGQPVTFTATVTPNVSGGPTPTGTVTFLVGSTVLGTVTLNSAGVATFTAGPFDLPTGSNVITARYDGTPLYAQSSGTFTQVVNAASTQTSLLVSPTRAVALQAVRLQAVVSAVSPGGGTPAGTVTFTDTTTGRTLGTATLVNGVATLWSHLGRPLGTHSIRATYSGSSDHNPSASTLASVTVIANGTRSSTVVLRSSLNPSNVGTPVTFTATVRDVDGSRTPTGTVAFYANGTVVGYGVLGRVRDGLSRATFTTDTLPVGLHTIVARYSGSSVYARSVSSPLTQDVRPPASRTSSVNLAVTPSSPTVYGQPLTLTATVTDTGSGAPITPTGTVVFYSHGVEVGRGSLSTVSAGLAQASITVTSLNVGTHDLQAEYLGDIEFVGGVLSGIVTHQVDAVASTVSVSSSPSPARFGGAFDLVATVRPVAPSVGIPTGQVIFRQGVTVLGTATLDSSGVARLQVSGWAVGSYPVEAEYLGDGNVLGSTGSGTVEVAPAATRVALSRSTTAAGQRLVIRARVTAVPPGGGVPSGVVQFYINGVLRGSGVLDSTGVAQLVLPGGLPVGVHVVRAVYVGDGNYLGSSVTESWGFGLGRNV